MPTTPHHPKLAIIEWPDPRLLKKCAPVKSFDPLLLNQVNQMLELMHAAPGVGLAAPQVGLNARFFVMNPTGNPDDDHVYVNPVLSLPHDQQTGEETDEEGCLSLPGIRANVVRSFKLRIDAQDVHGKPLTEEAEGYVARIWQHETDHLDGILLLDHLGPLAKIAARKTLRELKEKYEKTHPPTPKKRKK